jgi:hypothetical protein
LNSWPGELFDEMVGVHVLEVPDHERSLGRLGVELPVEGRGRPAEVLLQQAGGVGKHRGRGEVLRIGLVDHLVDLLRCGVGVEVGTYALADSRPVGEGDPGRLGGGQPQGLGEVASARRPCAGEEDDERNDDDAHRDGHQGVGAYDAG